VRPTETGFVYVLLNHMKDPSPELGIVDLNKKTSRVIQVKLLPELQRLWLRAVDQRKDGSFIASASWVENRLSRSGLFYIDQAGTITKKMGYDISVGNIAILQYGYVGATIQSPPYAEPQDAEKPHHLMSGFFDEESGALVMRSTMGWRGDFSTFTEQQRDLMVRSVSPVREGYVLTQPHSARASWVTHSAKRLPGGAPDPSGAGGMTTWFDGPEGGVQAAERKVVAIALMYVEDKVKYVVAWGRRRPGVHNLNPAEHESFYDDVVLSAYSEGGRQKPFITAEVPSDLYDLVSDGNRVFIVAGKGTGDWRIEEVHLR
jgi:hypothetical protein